jgi:hypothetical protein
LPDFLLAFVVREAVAESFVDHEILQGDGELPVFGRARAEAVGQGGIDLLLQGLHARIPAGLRHRHFEGPQNLDLPVDLFDGALDLGFIFGGWRSIFAVGHAGSSCDEPTL